LFDGVPGLFQKFHLSHSRTQRVSGGVDGRNRRVSRFFGCLARLLGSLPKALALLSDRLQLLATPLAERPRILGQNPELFCFLPRRFGHCAETFGTVTVPIRFLAEIFSIFARFLSVDAVRLGPCFLV
jgi:hypothetical protein